ncbi:MAG TPA: hypothetical protein VG328_22030 [Stellaceae bacterium]|jgi:hypothetical protein|nr:hypothetical protein [Stellaceae bacterium]
MITDAAFPFFARRKRTTTPPPRIVKETPRPKTARERLCFWRRRELTTFHKCLAVHMYYASPRQREQR